MGKKDWISLITIKKREKKYVTFSSLSVAVISLTIGGEMCVGTS